MNDEDLEEDLLYGLFVLMTGTYILKRRISFRWVNRKYWVRPINIRRPIQGDYDHLIQEMKADPYMFFKYTRMSINVFNYFSEIMKPFLMKKSHRALVPEQRLALILRYLATGDQILSVALAYRIGESTARNVIKETCTKIIEVLAPIYLQAPTEEQWKKICEGFSREWNFPNCCGAVDGKHVQIQAPPNSGSLYYNYKKVFSIVLLAACDSNYKFTLVDCGAYGSNNDAGVFSNSEFGKSLVDGHLNLPRGESNLPGSDKRTPCFFVVDEAFRLTANMMRPYSGRNLDTKRRIFNYRLSRARRVIENAFGILVSRWRVFRKPICMLPKTVDKIVIVTICLHNFLKTINDSISVESRTYCPPNFIDTEQVDGIIPGAWRNESGTGVENIRPSSCHRSTTEAYKQRDILADYFLSSAGEIPWQYMYIHRGCNAPDI